MSCDEFLLSSPLSLFVKTALLFFFVLALFGVERKFFRWVLQVQTQIFRSPPLSTPYPNSHLHTFPPLRPPHNFFPTMSDSPRVEVEAEVFEKVDGVWVAIRCPEDISKWLKHP